MKRLGLAIAVGIVGTSLVAASGGRPVQTPTFSTKVEAVRVDVLVTDRGQPVHGLGPADFEIVDSGVPQQPELAAFDEIPLNIVLVFDVSASMAGDRLDQLKAAGRVVVGSLQTQDRAGLITFTQAVQVRSALSDKAQQLIAAIDAAQAEGETSLVDAAQAGIVMGESDVGRALVILFSDGLDTASWLSADAVLRVARRSDAVVYGVSAGLRKSPPFLEDLCETTAGRLLNIASTEALSEVLLGVVREFRQRYLVSYTPRGVAKGGWHPLEVRVKGRRLTVKARPGYLAGTAAK